MCSIKALKDKRINLSKETMQMINRVYSEKIHTEKMSYGLLVSLIDISCIGVLIFSLLTIEIWTERVYLYIGVIVLLSIILTAMYTSKYIVTDIKLAKGKYIMIKDKYTHKETLKDMDFDNNGYNKYRVYRGREEFRVLIAEDYKFLNKEQDSYFIYMETLKGIYIPLFILSHNREILEKGYCEIIRGERWIPSSIKEKEQYLEEIGNREIEESNREKREKRYNKMHRIIRIIMNKDE